MPSRDPRSVFVVHGRDLPARDAMFSFLRTLGLDPQEWEQMVHYTGDAAPFVGDILRRGLSKAQAVVVLLGTEERADLDQLLWRKDDSKDDRGGWQPRPNVLFEAGMALAMLPRATVFVETSPVRHFSDISGRHTLRFDGGPASRQKLAERLRAAGCLVSTEGDDWLRAGDFALALAPPEERHENWAYALVRAYPETARGVVGCFQTRVVANASNAIKAVGRAYWVSPKISLRGEWTTEAALRQDDTLFLHYMMKSPAQGEIHNLSKADIHEGIISLNRRQGQVPFIGHATFFGYVHDLFSWRENSPSIYAEPVRDSWESLVRRIETAGTELFRAFEERLGVR